MSRVLTTRQPHMIDSVRWPQTNPPSSLQHLDRDGFDGGKSTGIVAVPQGSDGVWCVSAFSACEIQATPEFGPEAVKAMADSFAKRLEDRNQEDSRDSRQKQTSYDKRTYESLTVFGNFEHVAFNKTSYDLSSANQVREILRLLAKGGHTSPGKSVTKAEIRAHLEAKELVTPNVEWRPSFAFKGKWKALYNAVGTLNGKYWLK